MCLMLETGLLILMERIVKCYLNIDLQLLARNVKLCLGLKLWRDGNGGYVYHDLVEQFPMKDGKT